MNDKVKLAILYGGVSEEREVSLGSGRAAAQSFGRIFDVELFDVTDTVLPAGLDPDRHVVFSTLHGTFGEDGQIQKLMDDAGIAYAGCNSESSRLTFDKVDSKRALAEKGLPVFDQVEFNKAVIPEAAQIVEALGAELVLKPRCQGSSVGLHFVNGVDELKNALDDLPFEEWLVEPRANGEEFTVGVLAGRSLEVVAIRPKSGRFDYKSKYTKGETEYLVPAPVDVVAEKAMKRIARESFKACDCRDFARVDIMLHHGEPYVLEINTLPGLKETSLLPMSAAAAGLDFENLLRALIKPACSRYREMYSNC